MKKLFQTNGADYDLYLIFDQQWLVKIKVIERVNMVVNPAFEKSSDLVSLHPVEQASRAAHGLIQGVQYSLTC